MHEQSYPCKLDLDAVRQVQTGAKCPSQVCREHGITEGLLLRWRRKYEMHGEEASLPRLPSCEEGDRVERPSVQ